MNTSRRTTLVAEGAYLWAKCMDLPWKAVDSSPEMAAWNEWSTTHGPEMAKFAQDIQFALFDRVNNVRWAS